MDKYAKIREALGLGKLPKWAITTARVVSIEGDTCTVAVDAGETSGADYEFNTELTSEQETQYQAWRAELPEDLQNEEDYDLRGLWLSYPNIEPSENMHFPDTYKKPNHITFSNESTYSRAGREGGAWAEQNGAWTFYVSPFNLTQHTAAEIQGYFADAEPDASLVFPRVTPEQLRELEAANTGTTLSGVRLKPTTPQGATNKLLITPAVGSYVLIASQSGDWRDCNVIDCDEIEKIELIANGLVVEIDASTGKVDVHNDDTSFSGILSELTELLRTKYKVFTPSGPSGAALPDSVIALNEFENNFKKLLK